MFDVPVLEVTVSSAPTIVDSVSTLNKIATPSASQVSSALLNAAAVLTLPISAQSDVNGTNNGQNVSPDAQTIFPNSSAQLFEPLSLGDVAMSLEKVFELSLETQSSSKSDQVLLAKALSTSIDELSDAQVVNVIEVSDISTMAEDQTQIKTEIQKNIATHVKPKPGCLSKC